jgi:type IV secretory pathway TraG/TraD family ATPase VirD4
METTNKNTNNTNANNNKKVETKEQKIVRTIFSIIANSVFIACALAFILMMNIAGWMDGAQGGLSYSEFMTMFWWVIGIFLINAVVFGGLSLIVKRRATDLWEFSAKYLLTKFDYVLFGDDDTDAK